MRLYQALLRAYPASFRREFGPEMEAVFEARRRDADGPAGVLWLWLETVVDVLTNASMVHWDILRQDLRFIARSLRRAPGFTATAVLVTALGVGANAAAFSVTDFVLIRPLPFPKPEQLVTLWERLPGYPQMELSPANYRDWKAMSGSFEAMSAYTGFAANLAGTELPERVETAMVGAELFSVLRASAALGRTFTDADARPNAPLTLVLSDGLWRSRFGADPGIEGRPVSLDGTPYQVIGVMPAGFEFPDRRARLWTPLVFTEALYEDRGNNMLQVVARLTPGTSIERARADLAIVARRLEQLYPVANKETGATLNRLREEYSDRARLLLLALSGASLCILLIACANLGNLLLARGVTRQRELAVRTALGAGRERLVRQAITESLVIAGAGGVLGVLTAVVSVPLLARLVPDSLPMGGAPSVNLRVLVFAAALTLITSLLFTVLPTLRSGRDTDLGELRGGSRAGGGRKERVRAALVAVEIGASVVLLVAAGLLMRAIERVREVDPGFRPAGVFTVRTALPSTRYAMVADRERFYQQITSQVKALPGVTGAAYVTCLPMVCGGMIWPVAINGEAETREANNTASLRYATPGYFSVLGIPLLRGRDLSDRDRQDGASVAVVSQSFATRYWPNDDPLGKRFRMAFLDREVVGVVADIKVRGLERQNEPQVFLSSAQVADSAMAYYWPKDLAIKTSEGTATLLPAVRRIIQAADGEQPVSDPRTMTEVVGEQTATRAIQLRVLAALAVIALLLAGVGIHGLLSFMVSQRAREIGVRMALGARAGSVVRLVVGQAAWLAVAGIVPGLVLAYLAGTGMRAVLFGVPPADFLTFAVVVGLCLGMALAGSLIPALRAVRVDPITAIKAD